MSLVNKVLHLFGAHHTDKNDRKQINQLSMLIEKKMAEIHQLIGQAPDDDFSKYCEKQLAEVIMGHVQRIKNTPDFDKTGPLSNILSELEGMKLKLYDKLNNPHSSVSSDDSRDASSPGYSGRIYR